MKTAGKILIGIVSALLFIILLLLATIRFELLNKAFLFGSLEKYHVYAKLPSLLAASLPNDPNFSEEEGKGLAEFVKNISPQVIKPLIEDNLTQVLDYLNGESKNVVISFSIQGIGFENASGIRWSLSDLPDKNLQEKIKALNGAGNLLTIAGIIVLAILVGLFFLSGKIILLIGGLSIAVISLIIKFLLMVIGRELINGREPSQKLLGLLSSSLFSDITTTWLVAGMLLILLWLGIKIKKLVKWRREKMA